MTDKEALHQAFLAFRREHGMPAAHELIRKFGGDGGLDSVPAENRDDLLAAFEAGPLPKSFDELAPKAMARFNAPPKVKDNATR